MKKLLKLLFGTGVLALVFGLGYKQGEKEESKINDSKSGRFDWGK